MYLLQLGIAFRKSYPFRTRLESLTANIYIYCEIVEKMHMKTYFFFFKYCHITILLANKGI